MLYIHVLANKESHKIVYAMKQLKKAIADKNEIIHIEYESGFYSNQIFLSDDSVCLGSYIESAGACNAAVGLGDEAYVIECTGKLPLIVSVHAETEQGLLYGCLDLAEQFGLYGLSGITSKRELPYIKFRGFKCNLPWESYQEGYSSEINEAALWDLSVWESFLDRLARGRYNVLTLWSQHPYHLMVKIEKYPQACPYSDEEMDNKIVFWKRLFAMAKARGMDVYVLTWNIHLHEKFAAYYGFPVFAFDHPTVRDYLREAVKALISTYDDLDGFGTNPGERMYDVSPEKIEDFMLDVYFKALKESTRQIPFIVRNNWVSAEGLRKTLEKADYPGQVYVDWKFNRSHGLSTWKLHGADNNPLWNPPPEKYKILWHIRNEDAYLLQWGDPQFVSRHMTENRLEACEGYFFGSERVLPFLEEVRLCGDGKRLQTLDYDRRWYLYEIWGRTGYNPEPISRYWADRLNDYYGCNKGSFLLYELLRSASQVAIEFNTFWFGTSDPTGYVEGNLGFIPGGDSWDGKRDKRFLSITDYIFHECLDTDYITIPQYISVALKDREEAGLEMDMHGKVTPLDISKRLFAVHQYITGNLEKIEFSDYGLTSGTLQKELEWVVDDLYMWSCMSEYYAYKISAATYLYAFMRTGNGNFRIKARDLIRLAFSAYKRAAEYSKTRIARQGYDHFDIFHWSRYLDDSFKDIEIVEGMKTLEDISGEIRCFYLGAAESDGWAALMDSETEVETALKQLDMSNIDIQPERFLSETYIWGNEKKCWIDMPETALSLKVLMGVNTKAMLHELGKRYYTSVNFEKLFGMRGTAFFALVFESEKEEAALFELFTRDYAKIWVNGVKVFETHKAGWYTQGRKGGCFAACIKKGKNLLIIKLEAVRSLSTRVVVDRQDPEFWGFYLNRNIDGYPFFRHHIFPHTLRNVGKEV